MILRLIVLLIAVFLHSFGAPDENKATEIRKTIQGLKATVSQLQDQISVLEAQLASAESVNTPLSQSGASPAVAQPLAAVPAPASLSSSQPATKINDTARQQCSATTKKGTRCSRMAAAGKSTCWQHGG